jgi:hypothetical protein
MANDFVGISVEGLKEIRERLPKIITWAFPDAILEVAKFIRTELQRYPSPKRVSRKAAYGVTFSTDRQRKWYFANLREGTLRLPYRRTRALSRGWQIMPMGSRDHIVVNETPHARHVQPEQAGDQSRMMRIIGWLSIDRLIKKFDDRIGRIMARTVEKVIKRLGL